MKNRFGQSLKNVFEPYYLNKQKLKMQVNILFGKYKHFLGFVNHQSSFDMIDPVDYSRKIHSYKSSMEFLISDTLT